MSLSKVEINIVEVFALDPLFQFVQIFWDHIHSDDPARRCDSAGGAHGIIASASSNIGDGHAGPNAKKAQYLRSLAIAVARLFGGPLLGNDICNRAFWDRECTCWSSGRTKRPDGRRHVAGRFSRDRASLQQQNRKRYLGSQSF